MPGFQEADPLRIFEIKIDSIHYIEFTGKKTDSQSPRIFDTIEECQNIFNDLDSINWKNLFLSSSKYGYDSVETITIRGKFEIDDLALSSIINSKSLNESDLTEFKKLSKIITTLKNLTYSPIDTTTK